MNVENAISWIKTNKLKFWRIINNDKEIVAKIDDDTITLDDSLVLLSENINYLGDGSYKIFAKKEKNQTAGELTFLFFKKSNANISGFVSNDVNSEIIKNLQTEIEKMRQDHQAKIIEDKYRLELEKKDKVIEKLKEPKEKKSDPMEFIGQILMTAILGKSTLDIPTASISKPVIEHKPEPDQPTKSEPELENNLDENQIMQKAFENMNNAFSGTDITMLDFIHSVGEAAKNNTQSFISYAKLLINQHPLSKQEV